MNTIYSISRIERPSFARVFDATLNDFEAAWDDFGVKNKCGQIALLRDRLGKGEISNDEFEEMKSIVKTGMDKHHPMPFFTPHAYFPGGRRLDKEAVPNGRSSMDYDHLEITPEEFYNNNVRARVEELGVELVYKTASGAGLRILFRIPKEVYDIATDPKDAVVKAQQWFADKIGQKGFDDSTKDLARCSFFTPEENILYIDKVRMFEEVTITQDMCHGEGAEQVAAAAKASTAAAGPLKKLPVSELPDGYDGVPYEDIIDELAAAAGGVKANVNRNKFVFDSTRYLGPICDYNANFIYTILPSYGLDDDEFQKVILNGLNTKRYYRPSKEILAAIAAAKAKMDIATTDYTQAKKRDLEFPELPKRLTPFMRHILSQTPAHFRPAVAIAILPALAAHLHEVSFRYADNTLHEAALMAVVVAKSAGGKSLINGPIDAILKDLKDISDEGKRIEAEWRDECGRMGQSKDKPKRPTGLRIQVIPPNTTGPNFTNDLVNANGYPLVTIIPEIELLDNLGDRKQVFEIIKYAFDTSLWGQRRFGKDSVTGEARLRFNFTASTTPQKCQQYFAKHLLDGACNRITFAIIPPQPIGSDIPRQGDYDDVFVGTTQSYVKRLTEVQPGELKVDKKLESLARKLLNECRTKATLTQDEIYEELSRRACVMGWRAACILYILEGQKYSKEIENFALWVTRYALATNMALFYDAMKEQTKGGPLKTVHRDNLLLEVPEVFNIKDLMAVYVKHNLPPQNAQAMLDKCITRRIVERIPDATTPDGLPTFRSRIARG